MIALIGDTKRRVSNGDTWTRKTGILHNLSAVPVVNRDPGVFVEWFHALEIAPASVPVTTVWRSVQFMARSPLK